MRKILLTASLLLTVLCADGQRVFDRAERLSGYSWREEALGYLDPGVHVYVRGGLAVASLMGKERTESGWKFLSAAASSACSPPCVMS